MNIELFKTVGSIVGAIISLKIIFWLFSPTEIWTIILIFIFIFSAYAIQPVEWAENKSFSIFGFDIYQSSKVYQQYKILGIIPISQARLVETHDSFFKDINPALLAPTKTFVSMIPFSALINKVGKR